MESLNLEEKNKKEEFKFDFYRQINLPFSQGTHYFWMINDESRINTLLFQIFSNQLHK